jgi:hypothetical protein
MAAKTTLYILGGLLLIPGLYQFYNITQLEELRNSMMGAFVDVAIEQKRQFGYMLTIGGSILIAIGYFIKPKSTEKQ